MYYLTRIEPVVKHFDSCSYNWGHCLTRSFCKTARRGVRLPCKSFLTYVAIRDYFLCFSLTAAINNRDIVCVSRIQKFSTRFDTEVCPNLILMYYRFDTDCSLYSVQNDWYYFFQNATILTGMISLQLVNMNLFKTF